MVTSVSYTHLDVYKRQIVDRDEINKQLTGGYGTVVDCYATDATTDFAAIKDDIESELIHYSYDLDKAKQELIDGGWTLNEKGRCV